MMMRLWILCALLFSLAFDCYAKNVAKGALEFSASSSLALGTTEYSQKINNIETTTEESRIDAELQALYYVTKNVGVGLGLAFVDEVSVTADDESEYIFRFYGPAFITRAPVTEKNSVYISGMVGNLKSGRTENDVKIRDSSGTAFIISLGISHFLNENVSLNTEFQYSRSMAYDSLSDQTNEMKNKRLFIGVSFYTD